MRCVRILFSVVMLVMLSVGGVSAQTTDFTYQGSLKDGVNLANGNYDFEFALFNALTAGDQVGSTVTRSSVAVSNGIFSVSLDFGSQFPGASRFLEIRVRPAGGGAFNTLSPRQQIDSAPYSVKSLNTDTAANADQLGGVAASQYVVTTDPRMTDARSPTAGSADYIQNQNASPQASSNFNISGTGTANIFNATTQYNIGGNRVLSNGGSRNLFAGVGAGTANSGVGNAFFGNDAGSSNTTGGSNAFFGNDAGNSNTTGFDNAFFGSDAGVTNTTGFQNAFFGRFAGISNTSGANNAFFGRDAGASNTTGSNNSFFGVQAGPSNTMGSNNTIIGRDADVGANNLTNATAIGANARVNQSNSLVLGSINGTNGATADTKVGIGTTTPTERLHVVGDGLFTGKLGAGLFSGSGDLLTNLNASNIASGTLATGRGGTGIGASGAAGNYLRSNGTIWTSSALQAADIPAGNANYIQNTTSPQASSNFNVSGNGTVGGTLSGNIVNATTQYNIGGSRVLSNAGLNNLFAGVGAGTANSGSGNAFFGKDAGLSNTTGFSNAFFGKGAGSLNTGGSSNSFFGTDSGTASTGNANAFFGTGAGLINTIGSDNAFFGGAAGSQNTAGTDNAFFGRSAGDFNQTGDSNTIIGSSADVGVNNLTNATAIGANALVTQSNSLVLGSINGVNGATADTNVGIGTNAPTNLLTIGAPEATTATASVGVFSTAGTNIVVRETTNDVENIFGVSNSTGGVFGTTSNHNVNIRTNNTNRLRILSTGEVVIFNLGAAGATSLCLNGSSQISTCSSSLRYKTNIGQFGSGMSFVRQLRPISFDWKDGGMKDVGFGAEDIEKIDPRFVTYNDKGEVEGVKYDRLSVAFVNAFKEQQEQIETLQAFNAKHQEQAEIQQKENTELKKQVEALATVLCSIRSDAEICKTKEK